MLGEQIGEGHGRRTARRVVRVDAPFQVEVSFEDQGTLLGVAGMNIGTYTSEPKPDGNLHGLGQGVFASLEGEMVTWKAIGVGKFLAGGSVRYVGAISYTTSSAKLARLNGLAGVFEFETDAEGKATSSKTWAWE